jgi:hypothetical protein
MLDDVGKELRLAGVVDLGLAVHFVSPISATRR